MALFNKKKNQKAKKRVLTNKSRKKYPFITVQVRSVTVHRIRMNNGKPGTFLAFLIAQMSDRDIKAMIKVQQSVKLVEKVNGNYINL